MNLLPLAAGADGAVIDGTDGPAVAPIDCAGLHAGRAARAHHARCTASGVPAMVAAVEYLGADSLVTCRARQRDARRARRRQRRARAAATPTWLSWAARRPAFVRARRHAARRIASVAKPQRCSRRLDGSPCSSREEACGSIASVAPSAGSSPRVASARRVRAGAGRGLVLLPGRRRRADHQDRRRLRRRLREGEPRIKVKPIYAGTYQESITKALTARQERRAAGDVDPAVDRHVHADRRGRDRAVRRPHQDAPTTRRGSRASTRRSWRTARPAARPGASRSSARPIVLYWNKELFKEAGLDPNRPPANWKEQVEYAQKLTKRDASGKVTQWGVQIPSSGFPYWLFQALAIQAGANLMNAAGTQTYYDKPEVIEALQYWVDLVEEAQGASRGHRRVGHDAEGLLREEGRDDVDDDRQPDQRARPTPSSTSASRCCRRASSAAARPAAATSTSSRRRRRRSARRRSSSSSGSPRRSAPRSGASTPATSRCAPTPGRRRR